MNNLIAAGEAIPGVMGIIQTITQAISDFLGGIGTSIVDFFGTTFIKVDGSLTTFAIVTFSMIGLGIASGIVASIFKMVKR